jgi:hypothetical protein
MDALADKGYHTGVQLEQCKDNNIKTFVSPKAPSTKNVGLYLVTDFVYHREEDKYICPQGHQMHTMVTGTIIAMGAKTAKGYSGSKDITLLLARPVQAGIYVPAIKQKTLH